MRALGFPDVANDRAKVELRKLARRLGSLTPEYIVSRRQNISSVDLNQRIWKNTFQRSRLAEAAYPEWIETYDDAFSMK